MKPKQITFIAIGIAAAVILLLLFSGLFVVTEMEYAVITQFGEPVRTILEPGLKFRTPFVQKAQYLPRRILRWRGQGKELVTKDKTYIWADTWALWKITDPLRFYQTLGTVPRGHGLLDDQIESATKDVVAGQDLIELVRSSDRDMQYTSMEVKKAIGQTRKIGVGRPEMCRRVLEAASSVVVKEKGDKATKGTLEGLYGLRLVDVQINHVIYVQKVQMAVYARMRAERKRIAEKFRSEGREKVAQIRGETEKEQKSIISSGYRKAQQLRGEGDAEALTIYAKSYSRDPEFFRFWKTLKTYEKSVDGKTVLVLSLDSEYFRILGNPKLDEGKKGSAP